MTVDNGKQKSRQIIDDLLDMLTAEETETIRRVLAEMIRLREQTKETRSG